MFKDKNILYIVHNYTSFQKDQIEEASRHFNKVYVLVRYKLITVIANVLKLKVLQKYREENCIDLHDLPSNVEVFKTPVMYIPYGFLYRLVGNVHHQAVRKVVFKNKLEFDIIHAHFIWSSGYAAMKLSEEYRKPFVVTGHGYDVYVLPFRNKWWNKITREIVESASKVITISSSNKLKLIKLTPKKEIQIVYNGFSSKLFYPVGKKNVRAELGIDLSKRVCLTVGNLIEIKGFEYLIEAISLLPSGYSDVVLFIVGAGHLEYKLNNLIKKYGLEERIFLAGLRPHSEIAKWINSADLFVISSRMEGGPVVLLESLGCGVPVVGTRVGIVEETLQPPTYGYVCEPEDANDLRNVIIKALSRNWDKKEISEYGKNFTWAKAVEEMSEIYKEIIYRK